MRHSNASVHVEDRGLQFADSIYEVFAVEEGRLLDERDHLDRLERNLGAVGMDMPLARGALRIVLAETLRRNRLRQGLLYLQVTRGAHRRNHTIPENAQPTVIVTAYRTDPAAAEKRRREGVSVITMPDLRWKRCDIKTTGLLANVLAKTKAWRMGAYEVWFTDEKGYVTEGASTNAWIVTANGALVTRTLDWRILPGVTRAILLRAAGSAQIRVEERAFRVEEARQAREAFITSASGGVIPVIEIDGQKLGGGKPGPMAAQLQALYRAQSQTDALR